MNDLISKSALLNIVEPRLDYLLDKYGVNDDFVLGYEECYEQIAAAPTIEQPKWISCAERLPKLWETVLTYRPKLKSILFDYVCVEGGWSNDDIYSVPVTHWMPLPQPPKGDE